MSELEHPVFGLHAVQTLLNSTPDRVNQLYVLKGREDHKLKKIRHLAERNEIGIEQVSRSQLDQWAEGNHQGVIASCKPGKLYDESFLFESLAEFSGTPLILALDGITDPHNLGACLRSAEAAGVNWVIAPKDNAVGITPVVSKVACGAAEIVPLVTVTNLVRTLNKLRDQGLWTVGAAGEATQIHSATNLTGPIIVVMGAEGKGLRRLTREACDHLVKIPMMGQVSSLNVSVATGVILFEALRQRAALEE